MAETEDIPYSATPDFATPEDDKQPDADQPNKSMLVELSKEMEKDIATNKSFDSVKLPANATPDQKIAAFDDMTIHKGLALCLEKYKAMIDKKLEELV